MDTKSIFKGKKIGYWLVGLLVVLIALFVFLRPNATGKANSTSDASTGTVTSVDVSEPVEASGSLEAQPSATLTWNADGVVEKVYVQTGDKVKAGDVLMKVKTTSVDANIISAQADLATAQKNLDDLLSSSNTDLAQAVIGLRNAQEDYDKAADYLHYLETSKKVPQTETRATTQTRTNSWMYIYKTKAYKGPAPEDWVIEAKNDLALKKGKLEDAQHTYDRLKDGPNAQDVTAAQAKVDAAQATVDSMSIIAPFDGEVLYIESQPGDLVEKGAPAADFANLDHLYVESQVDESDIASVKVGNPVTATLDAVPNVQLTGKVVALDPVGEKDSGLVKYTVLIDIDQGAGKVFLPLGATANVTIQVKEATKSLAVPANLVQSDNRGEYVWLLQADGSTKRVDVVTGKVMDDVVTVTGDLKDGDTLTMSGGGR